MRRIVDGLMIVAVAVAAFTLTPGRAGLLQVADADAARLSAGQGSGPPLNVCSFSLLGNSTFCTPGCDSGEQGSNGTFWKTPAAVPCTDAAGCGVMPDIVQATQCSSS